MMNILGIIPARGGSKGIHRKNLVDLCGKPLIAWSIEFGAELLKRNLVSRCIVSTDDMEIAQVARNLGADVPFLRPGSAATDSAKAIDYVRHALDTLSGEGHSFDAVVLLQPTSPIRDIGAFEIALQCMERSDADSLISCYEEEYINDLVMYDVDEDDRLVARNPDHNKGVRRQQHGSAMIRNGAVYVTRTSYLLRTGHLVCDRPILMRMNKIDSVDVDTVDDLHLLRAILCK